MSQITKSMIVAALMPFADEADLNISESESDQDAYRSKRNSLKVGDFRLARKVCDAIASEVESKADADLIASYPQLLECLKEARSKLSDQSEIDLTYIDEVIAKAESRA